MIEIEVSDNQVTLSGHAGYAEQGKDIVCAGISALIPALVNSLIMLDEDVLIATHTEGESDIRFPNSLSPKGSNVLTAFCISFKDISEQFPNNVSYQDNRNL